MKKSYILFVLTMVAALTTVSCNCSSKKSQEYTQEEVQEMKQALADSVLAQIDSFAEEYFAASETSFFTRSFELSEKEKVVKPDYLLNLTEANDLVTKSQKINALAIYLVDLGVRTIYDMPLDETKEVIAKLAVELNHPTDVIANIENVPVTENIKKEYENCRERGDLAYFWQFQDGIITETNYIISQTPELYFSKITEEQWQAYVKRTNEIYKTMRELAKYDKEMAVVLEMFNKNKVISSPEEFAKVTTSIESEKQFRIANKDNFIAKRNALLQ